MRQWGREDGRGMCETGGRAIGQPCWGRLYGTTLTPLAALALVEAAAPPALLRAVLRYGLVLAIVVGLSLWVRGNRTALDLQQWCTCAPGTISVRVIESRPAALADPVPAASDPAVADRDALIAV